MDQLSTGTLNKKWKYWYEKTGLCCSTFPPDGTLDLGLKTFDLVPLKKTALIYCTYIFQLSFIFAILKKLGKYVRVEETTNYGQHFTSKN